MNTETAKIIIDILKFYYVDVVMAFFMFFLGLGLGLSIRELFEEVFKCKGDMKYVSKSNNTHR